MDTSALTLSIGIIGVLILVLVILIIFLHIKIKKLLGNTTAKTIEQGIHSLSEEIKELQQFQSDTEKYLESAEQRIRSSVRGIQTVRFNPFKGTGSGGNQSFATAFINEDGDGVIISSLYTRDHVSMFAKPIKKHLSEFELTEEEKEALQKAKQVSSKK